MCDTKHQEGRCSWLGEQLTELYQQLLPNMSSSSSSQAGSTYFRIDSEHQLLEMMQATVARICAAKIQVAMHDDSVLLSGSVNSWYDKQQAQESLRRLTGARTILNELAVH